MTLLKPFDVELVRKDFPCLHQSIYEKPLAYLDNAATAQKPQCVIDEMRVYYEKLTANIHRGAHRLSEIATDKYHEAREYVARFINAPTSKEIVFTRGATEAINLVAFGLSRILFKPGDEIILTEMEHHSNIVPWYLVAKEKNLTLKIVPILDNGELDLVAFRNLFNEKTKLAAFAHASNVLGTINPIKEMVAFAKTQSVPTLIDGAQAAPHIRIDVQDIGADFYCFSGHKIYGPTGIGVLYARTSWLDAFPPYQGGGDMIQSVSFDEILFAKAPEKFEAGTPHIAGALGLKKALEYIDNLGHEKIYAYENFLYQYAKEKLSDFPKIKMIGSASKKVSLISFVIEGVHPHDVASIFDREGIAIRAGHLCAEPLLKRLKTTALSRASFSFYNTTTEIDRFIHALKRVFEVFKI